MSYSIFSNSYIKNLNKEYERGRIYNRDLVEIGGNKVIYFTEFVIDDCLFVFSDFISKESLGNVDLEVLSITHKNEILASDSLDKMIEVLNKSLYTSIHSVNNKYFSFTMKK